MERFIAKNLYSSSLFVSIFKIQYGKIYSHLPRPARSLLEYLKSSMERFIEMGKPLLHLNKKI